MDKDEDMVCVRMWGGGGGGGVGVGGGGGGSIVVESQIQVLLLMTVYCVDLCKAFFLRRGIAGSGDS